MNTGRRATCYWPVLLVMWLLIFAIVVVVVFVSVTARPEAEPAVPAYVEELHAHMSDIKHRLLQLEVLVGETQDLMVVVQHLLEGGEWLYYVEIALEKEGE